MKQIITKTKKRFHTDELKVTVGDHGLNLYDIIWRDLRDKLWNTTNIELFSCVSLKDSNAIRSYLRFVLYEKTDGIKVSQ